MECDQREDEDNSDTDQDHDSEDENDFQLGNDGPHLENASCLIPKTTVTIVQNIYQNEDQEISNMYNSLKRRIQNAIQSDTLEALIKELSENDNIKDTRDHLGHSLLHLAVEGHTDIVECLFSIGFNPNIREKCGATPLIIAVISKNKEVCDILVKNRACVRGPLFTNVPSPIEMAKRLELTEICEMFSTRQSDDEDGDISKYDPSYKVEEGHSSEKSDQDVQVINRETPGFLTGVIGDVGTCKTNRGGLSRLSGYEWIGIIPGDLHTKGYLAEACSTIWSTKYLRDLN